MTNYNSSVQTQQLTLSNTSSNSQLLKPESTINLEYQSQLKLNQEELGQTSTEYYYHPYSNHLRFDEEGTPYTDIFRGNIVPWEPHPIFKKSKKGSRWKINLRNEIAQDIYYLPRSSSHKESTNQFLARIAAECFFNKRIPEGFHVCHINGDPTDNSKNNLRISDCINNAIDEVSLGRQGTDITNIDLAIERLKDLRKSFEIIN